MSSLPNDFFLFCQLSQYAKILQNPLNFILTWLKVKHTTP
jgi:hypothetical protein